jgi:translation initiation factor 2 alpha subunit (eIF-2alpha)
LTIQNFGESGVEGIKKLLEEKYANKEYYKIRYIKAPEYLLTVNADDTKKTISENKKILDGIDKKSKELGIKFAFKELKR